MNILRINLFLLIFLLTACGSPDSTIIQFPENLCESPGRLVPKGEIPTPEDLAADAYCAKQIMQRKAPNGVITIFGSSRAKEDMESYKITRKFANLWTKETNKATGKKYPILTGGGPGLMEAGNRGAKEAGGESLSFALYFRKGDATYNKYTTEGYVFSSFSQREADMIDYAAGVVVVPGGIGTEWELYETLAKIQTGKKKPCPLLLLGKKQLWATVFARLEYLKKIKTISPENIDLLRIVETPEEAVAILKKTLIK
ncbi:MAG: hypothetical protein GY754_37105 [bacterium]|nr:hypothetical protein [bacterium]